MRRYGAVRSLAWAWSARRSRRANCWHCARVEIYRRIREPSRTDGGEKSNRAGCSRLLGCCSRTAGRKLSHSRVVSQHSDYDAPQELADCGHWRRGAGKAAKRATAHLAPTCTDRVYDCQETMPLEEQCEGGEAFTREGSSVAVEGARGAMTSGADGDGLG